MHERARPAGYVCLIERDDSTSTGSYSYLIETHHVIVMHGRYGLHRSIACSDHLHTYVYIHTVRALATYNVFERHGQLACVCLYLYISSIREGGRERLQIMNEKEREGEREITNNVYIA